MFVPSLKGIDEKDLWNYQYICECMFNSIPICVSHLDKTDLWVVFNQNELKIFVFIIINFVN